MSADDRDNAFEQRTRELLNDSADSLDARIRSRLTQARFAAVEEARKQRLSVFWRNWAPAGAVAGAAAVAVLLWSGSGRAPHAPAIDATPLDDMELITADEHLEMIAELEFYAWLPTSG